MKEYKGYQLVETLEEAEVLYADIEKMSEEEWKEARTSNIGGSDQGAINHCGYRTCLDVQLDKLGLKVEEEKSLEETIPLHVGHLLEDFVVQLFAEKNPGWEPFFDRRMLKHPIYPLHANCDGMVRHPVTNELYILEIKTCSEQVVWDKWGAPDEEKVPRDYELQCRHYMAVTGAVGTIIVCLAGNNAAGYRQRFIKRDLDKEVELIKNSLAFWEKVESGELIDVKSENPLKILENLQQLYGNNDEKEMVDLTASLKDVVEKYNEVKQKRLALDKEVRELKKTEASLLSDMIAEAEENNAFVELDEGEVYDLTWKHTIRRSVPSANLATMLEIAPEIEGYIKTSESDSFEVKKRKKK